MSAVGCRVATASVAHMANIANIIRLLRIVFPPPAMLGERATVDKAHAATTSGAPTFTRFRPAALAS